MKIITVANQKGGVGKTTVATNMPVFLANQHKKKCLVIDFDPQANTTSYLMSGKIEEQTFEELLLEDEPDINKFITSTKWNVDLIPSNISASNVELELLGKYNRDRRLETRLMDLEKEYDFIFIDTPPAVVGLITLNALVSSNEVWIVCNTEKFAVDGLVHLMRTIGRIRNEYRKEELYFRCIINQFDKRRIIDREVQEAIEELLGPLLFDTAIHQNTDISKSVAESIPLYFHNNNCAGYFDYTKLAKEVNTIYVDEQSQKEKNATTYQNSNMD